MQYMVIDPATVTSDGVAGAESFDDRPSYGRGGRGRFDVACGLIEDLVDLGRLGEAGGAEMVGKAGDGLQAQDGRTVEHVVDALVGQPPCDAQIGQRVKPAVLGDGLPDRGDVDVLDNRRP